MSNQRRTPTKETSCVLLAFLLWITLLHTSGLYLFTRGFFLTRYEIPLKSDCSASPSPVIALNNTSANKNLQSSTSDCWYPQRFSKAVIIIIDALRHDYLLDLPNEKEGAFNHNQVPIVHELLERKPLNSLFFKFRADPPTVTMQRLKGITTGGMPTFIDVSSNFDSSAIFEDNLIDQLTKNGRRITFMGDDTWVSLFPTQIKRMFPYPSFNVKDLHTVDNGVLSHLIPEMTGSTKEEWDILIAHFLGVDHVGHRYESNHPAMADKLAQMNKMIGEVVEVLDEETLLIVMGDHGATNDGNHGGATEEELNAALFLYSRSKPLTTPPLAQEDGVSGKRKMTENDDRTHHRTVSQIDIVPTLALLLGVPIPFGNLGGIVVEPFFAAPSSTHTQQHSSETSSVASFQSVNFALHLNSWQIFNYVKAYAAYSGEFSPSKLTELEQLFNQTNTRFLESLKTDIESEETLHLQQRIFDEYQQFQHKVTEMCREMWVSFDVVTMIYGMAILVGSLLVLLLQLLAKPSILTPRDATSGIVYAVPFFPIRAVVVGALLGTTIHLPLSGTHLWIVHSVLGFAFGSLLGYLSAVLSHLFARTTSFPSDLTNATRMENLTMALLLLLHGIGLFSNSYIEYEYGVVRFILFSQFSATLFAVIRSSSNKQLANSTSTAQSDFKLIGQIFLLMLVIKCSIWLCSGGLYEGSSTSISHFIAESLLPLVIIYWGLYNQLRNYGIRRPNFFASMAFLTVSLFWISQRIETNVMGETPWWMRVLLPQLVYFSSLLGLLWTLYLRKPTEATTEVDWKWLMIGDHLAILWTLVPIIIVVLGLKGSLDVGFLLAQFLLFQKVTTQIEEQRSTTVDQKSNNRTAIVQSNLGIPSYSILLCGFFTVQYFFATGHSYEFNTLHWAAAFVGFEEMNRIGGGLLVFLETFSAHILMSILLPVLLLSLSKVPLFQSSSPGSTTSDKESKKNPQQPALRPNYQSLLFYPFLLFVFFWSFKSVLTTVFVFTQRRALMVWRVFAPKYVYEGIIMVVVDILLLLSLYITHWSYHRTTVRLKHLAAKKE